MAEQNNVQEVKYQFYGQEPMTLQERTEFLQAAREQEKAYDDYLAKLANRRIVDNLPHEYLPDVDDLQHLYRDPEHPFNLRSDIAFHEFRLQQLEDKIKESQYNLIQLNQLQAESDALKAELEVKQQTLMAKEAARSADNEVGIAGSVEIKATESVSQGGNVGTTPWHKTADVWNYPANLTAGFDKTVESGLFALRNGQTSPSPYTPKPTFTDSAAKALFTNDKEAPTHTSWHKKGSVNVYTDLISAEQLKRTVESNFADKPRHAANDHASAQMGESSGHALQQAAETRTAAQAGDISTYGHGRTTQNMSTVLPVLGKAFAGHTLAPLGSEALFQADAAREAIAKADKDYANGLLNQQQLEIVSSNTKVTAAEASAAAIVPEPGLGIDKIVQAGDRKLVSELVKTGLPREQAEQYEMGSMIESGHRLAALATDSLANRNDVKRMVDVDGAVRLSVALNIDQAQLRHFGAMSATLGGEALKSEVARNPAFERLAHLSPQKIEGLSQMAAAGVDPMVMDRGYITTISNRPVQLSRDSKVAFIESANYIMQSGDVAFRVPGNRPVELKATVESFAMTYERLAQDGGLSKQDKAALETSINMLAEGVGTGRLQGVVARYEAAHALPVVANDAEHAMSMQR